MHYAHTGLPTDAIQVQSISVVPDPPVPGKDLSVTAVGTALEPIEVCFLHCQPLSSIRAC